MPELRVRNLEGWVLQALKDQARSHGRSLEGELRDRLTELALQPRLEMADRTARLRQAIGQECGLLPDSTADIRKDREQRG